MNDMTTADIVLYDLACTKGVCFSPVVWRIRLLLNYKKISYTTVFLEFPDIEPTLKDLGVQPSATASGHGATYTVPTIHHRPTNKIIMDSSKIASFLESTYPTPHVPLSSPLGTQIEGYLRGKLGRPYYKSTVPRELLIFSPKSQDYFRSTREPVLGCRLEDMLDSKQEEEDWKAVQGELQEVSDLMRTNSAQGPFILGAEPSYTDFFVAGTMRSARTIDEGVFQRMYQMEGFKQIYDACLQFMDNDQ